MNQTNEEQRRQEMIASIDFMLEKLCFKKIKLVYYLVREYYQQK